MSMIFRPQTKPIPMCIIPLASKPQYALGCGLFSRIDLSSSRVMISSVPLATKLSRVSRSKIARLSLGSVRHYSSRTHCDVLIFFLAVGGFAEGLGIDIADSSAPFAHDTNTQTSLEGFAPLSWLSRRWAALVPPQLSHVVSQTAGQDQAPWPLLDSRVSSSRLPVGGPLLLSQPRGLQ